MLGSGTWFDASGTAHNEYRLVELMVSPDEIGPSADFPCITTCGASVIFEVIRTQLSTPPNAPRLSSALRELVQALGVEAELGEPTYYGRADSYELEAADIIDGRGPDLTDAVFG
ncbi:hypothetical protein GCM10020227_27670 [Streptomyces flavovirens]